MIDLNKIDLVYCFQTKILNTALRNWQDEQVSAFPGREKEISVVVAAMRDFMTSAHVMEQGMVVKQLLDRSRQAMNKNRRIAVY